jgi:hypothetical protein
LHELFEGQIGQVDAVLGGYGKLFVAGDLGLDGVLFGYGQGAGFDQLLGDFQLAAALGDAAFGAFGLLLG